MMHAVISEVKDRFVPVFISAGYGFTDAISLDRIARTTATNPVPDGKRRRGYRHVADKFSESGVLDEAGAEPKAGAI
jgi:hypothetical protein